MAGKYEKKKMPSPDKNNSKSIVVPSRKKKLIFITSIIVIFIILVGIVVSIYLEETKDIRRMKSHTQGCIEDLEQIQNELYAYTPISNNRRFYSYSASSFSAAGRGIAWLRDLYNWLEEGDRQVYEEYLQSTFNISWKELDSAFCQYGLDSGSLKDVIELPDDYYEDLLDELRKEEQRAKGEVSVTNINVSQSGDNYAVTGSVKNTTAHTVYFVKIRITSHDKDGNVINTDSTYAVGGEGLRTGESTTFECYTKMLNDTQEIHAEIYEYDT